MVVDTDYMVPVESRIPKPVSYTSSVAGSLPSHLAFGRRNHRVTLPDRCKPFLGGSESRLVVNAVSGLLEPRSAMVSDISVIFIFSLHAKFRIERDADLRLQAENVLSTTSAMNGRVPHNDVSHCLG